MKILPVLLVFLYFSHNSFSKNTDFLDGSVQIVSEEYQKSINIPGASIREGENLIIWDKNDCGFNQEWLIEPVGEYYAIKSKYNGFYITAQDSLVQQNTYMGNNNQLWDIQSTEWGYIIISKEIQLALTASNYYLPKFTMVLSRFENANSQIWNFYPSGMEYEDAEFNRILSIDEMTEDVECFFEKLEEVHVNPYAFVSKDSVEQRKAELLTKLTKPLKRYQFVREIAALNGMFDGHTGLSEILDEGYISRYSTKFGRFIPYQFKYQSGKLMFDTEIDSLKHLEIKAINNIPVVILIAEIEKRVNYENRQMRNSRIEDVLQYFLFGLFDEEFPYEIKVVDTLTKGDGLIILEGLPSFLIPNPLKVSWKPYDFRIYPEESIAIIEHNTCRNGNGKFKARIAFIDSVFRIILDADIKHLFIDISRNGGGGSTANNVFYENINHDQNPWEFKFIRKVSLESKMHLTGFSKYFSSTPYEERLSKYNTYVNSKSISEFDSKFIGLKNGSLKEGSNIKGIDEVVDGYPNNVYLLQSQRTYSAGFEVSAWFKYGDVGKIIGSETGGTTEVYIEAIPLTLPNSKINFKVADEYNKYPGGNLKEGIKPDIDLGNDFYKEKYELEDLQGFLEVIESDK